MLLSIIIPIYNGKEYLRKCIQSALDIECEKEILLIDDGSTDGSYELMLKWFGNNPEVILFNKMNGGIVDTRNYGLLHAKGKYVIFQDQDDIICANTILLMLHRLEKENADIGIWSTEFLTENGTRYLCDSVLREGIYYKDNIVKDIIVQMLINDGNTEISYIGHVWQAIYKHDIIVNYNINFKKFVDIEDDYLFVFDFLLKADKLVTIKEVGYVWRYNKNSETYKTKVIDNQIEKYKDFYMYIVDCLKEIGVDQYISEDYYIFSKQDTYIMSIENSCVMRNGFWWNYKFYKSELCEAGNIEVFTNNAMVRKYKKRRLRIFVLLKLKAIFVACLYVYIDSLYRVFKKKIRG